MIFSNDISQVEIMKEREKLSGSRDKQHLEHIIHIHVLGVLVIKMVYISSF